MSEIPKNLKKAAATVFAEDTAKQEKFIESLLTGESERDAIIWLAQRPQSMPFECLSERPTWLPEFVDYLAPNIRAGKHELHERGAYYCLDLSSVFCASILSGVDVKIKSIFDICSAPGGKTTFAWKLFAPEILVCNEVIAKRNGALISNLKRCGIAPTGVTNIDVSHLANICEASCDLVIVDAPCSGQSLRSKGKISPGCFHPAMINMNSNRQKRILANSAKIVGPGGYLAYMTCTYSPQENEGVVEWLLKKFDQFEAVEVDALSEHRSHLSEFPAYRLWPFEGFGTGGFAVLLKRKGVFQSNLPDLQQLKFAWQNI